MTHDGARGGRFVAGMIAALCAICGLAALFGVPAADGVFLGLGGMLLGMGAARFLLPRRDWGLAGRTALVFLAIGGLFAGYHLSVIGFSTVRGGVALGAVLRFLVRGRSQAHRPHRPRAHRGVKAKRRLRDRKLPYRLYAPECVAMRSSEGRA